MIDELTLRYAMKAEAMMANASFFEFVKSMHPTYKFKWFHKDIAEKLQDVYSGKIKWLMILIPPQHAKSELASRQFPAWCLGKNPRLRISGSSYSSDLAQGFSRSIQRIIDNPIYIEFFPETYLNSANARTESKGYLRNVDLFETVKYGGSYKAVGVCGALTGNKIDIGIIDDPVKDAIEAYSETYRERVWDWYLNVYRTRLHNESRTILIMTRWHSDDLAGRLLQDEKEGGEQWEVISLPYIKEGQPTEEDPRQDGEALWPEMHSKEKALQTQRMSLKVYNSLYQQRPAAVEGSIFKYDWFRTYTMDSLKAKEEFEGQRAIWHFVGDTAYEDKEKNDPSALMAYSFFMNDLYIADVARVYMQMPELIRFTKDFVKRNRYTMQSTVKIEPKASGKSLVQMLHRETGLNISEGITPTKDKKARAEVCVPFVESGRVYLLEGAAWVDMFLDEVCTFPNGRHDDIVDCFTMAIKECHQDKSDYFSFSVAG